MSSLNAVSFVPSETLTFDPDGSKQRVYIEVSNHCEKKVIFKTKSTMPGVIKFRPVFGLIGAGETMRIRVILKTTLPVDMNKKKDNKMDHVSILLAVAQPTWTNAEVTWKEKKEQVAAGETKKKTINIVWASVE